MHRAALLVPLALLPACGEKPEPAAKAPEPPAFTPETNAAADPPSRPDGRFLTARVTRRTQLRARPRGKVLDTIGRRTEFESPRVLSVVGRRDRWLKVIAAERPNHRPAWIPRDAAKLGETDYSIEVDRSERRLRLRRGRRVVHAMTVAVGRKGNETPLGRFAVTDRLHTGDPASPYGCCAVALSGHQTKLVPGWPGGDRLAVHGTPDESQVGQAVSLGCMRARRDDIQTLMRRVPLGAPVFIRA